MKFIYRFAELSWVFWALSAVAALFEPASGELRAAGFSVVGAMLFCIMGSYAAEGRQSGMEQVISGRAAMREWAARFIACSAPVASALGLVTVLVYMLGVKNTDSGLGFIYIAPNAVLAAASIYGAARVLSGKGGPVRGGERPVLDRPRFLAGAALLGVVVACFILLVATRSGDSAVEGLRAAASWTMVAATLGYLALMFRVRGYRLSRAPEAVMDAGEHPSRWARHFLIYTAQAGVICVGFNLLLLIVVNMKNRDWVMQASVACMTGVLEAAVIALLMVLQRIIRRKPFPRAVAQRQPDRPAASESTQPALKADEWEDRKKTRARELEKELAESASTAPQAQATVPEAQASAQKPTIAPQAPKTVSGTAAAKATATQQQRPAASQASNKAKGISRTPPSQAQSKVGKQVALNRLRATQLDKEAAEAGYAMPRARLTELLKAAAARLEPHGAALATLEGQQALFSELAELLPGLNGLPSSAALKNGTLSEQAGLPGAVGEALSGACDLLAKVDFETVGAKWNMLPPARLVRGWRALTAYRDITNARMLFDAAIDCIEDCIAARADCADWLLSHVE